MIKMDSLKKNDRIRAKSIKRLVLSQFLELIKAPRLKPILQ